MDALFHGNSLLSLLIRFVVNLIFLFILIKLLYFRYTKKEKFLFTFFLIGVTVFFICSILKDITIDIGIGLGLFAIFTILRFRTRNFSVKDMAYIFTTIGISVINSVNTQSINFIGFCIINAIIILTAFILEEYLKNNSFCKYSIFYDNLDLLKPSSRNKLMKDLSFRLGHNILKINIRNIDLKRKIAQLDVFYKE
jgi:hypothetical protein